MAVELATAYVQLVPSAQGIKAGIQRELNLDAVARTAGTSAGRSLGTSMIQGATAVAAGVAIGAFFRSAFDEAQEAQKVGAQTAAVLKSTGEAAHVSAGQVGELAGALSEKAGIDDEVIQSGENVLLTFTKVRNEAGKGNDIFDRATKSALDMSVALGTDLKSANLQLGKALNDPIKGITALTRAGVSFTEAQKAQITALAETGDRLGAQKIILREVATEFAGSAAAQATSADKAKVAIGNLQEAVGVALMPAFNAAAKAISFFTGLLNNMPEPIRNIVVITGTLGGALLTAAVVATKFGGAFALIKTGAVAAGEGIAGLTSLIRGFGVASVLASGGVILGVAAVAALAGVLASTEGPFERITSSAQKWGQSTVAAAKRSGEEFRSLSLTQKALTGQIEITKAALARLQDQQFADGTQTEIESRQNRELSATLLDLETKHKALVPQLARLRAERDAEQASVATAKTAVEKYTAAMALGATQTQALAAAGKAGQDAIQGFQDTLLAAAGGAVGYAQSQANLKKAQDEYNIAVFAFGPASAEAQAAQLALNQAQLANVGAAQSADAAQQALIDSLVAGTTSYDEQISLLYDQIQLHPENAAGIQLEVDKLNAAKTAADSIPGTKSITVTAETSQAQAALDRLIAGVGTLRDQVLAAGGNPAAAYSGGRASGGPVTVGRTYMVGEQGRELFVPAVDGRILSHAASMKALAAGTPTTGGGGLHIDQAFFGDRDAIPELDYFVRTRMVGA